MTPLLAFGFASPLLLGGLALGSIPVVIHLLHKRRYREVPWAAMRFLAAAAKKNARRLRLEQLLLLAVRVLILVLLALALAQPYVESFGVVSRPDAPVHRILVVDTSLSMQYQPGDQSRFERARELARQIAGDVQQGDALNLIRIGGTEPRAVISEPTFQAGQAIDEIDRLEATEERGDLLPSLKLAAEALGKAPEIRQKEVYFLSDFQRAGWLPEASGENPQIRQQLRALAERATLSFIDVGQFDSPNAAVTSFTADEPFITVGRPVHLQATLRNFADVPMLGQTVELHVDGRLASTVRLDLPADGQAQAAFAHTFSDSGEHRLEVRLGADGLAADDRRYLALPVKDELNVLLVNGRQAGRAAENATYYLEQALAPATERQRWQGFTRPRVIGEGDLGSADLSRYDCVLLSNVGLFTHREAEILRAYLDSGGGVVFFLGDRVKPENYNSVLYNEGRGILPAQLGNRIGDARKPERVFEFDTTSLDHPIISPFRGNAGAGLETDFTLEYVEAVPSPEAQARVVLRYTSGDPAMIDASVGRGRVVLVTTSADNRWGPWPIQRSFLPIVHETVRYLASGQWSERQMLVAAPLSRAYPIRASGLTATLKRPDGVREPLPIYESGGTSSLRFEQTRHSGIYELRLGSPLGRTELFAVNVDARESDLETLDEAELRTGLLPGIDFIYHTDWQPTDRLATGSGPSRSDLVRLLLLAMFGLIFVEQVMAWRFVPGVLLLYGLAAAGFVWHGWMWNGSVGLVLAVVFLAGFAAAVLRIGRQRSVRV